MAEFHEPEIIKASQEQDSISKKKEEFIAPRLYKYESKYGDPEQIEREDKEVLLFNFRHELKEMQDDIKAKKSPDDLYLKEDYILKLESDRLTVEDAKIWEYFKIFSANMEGLKEFDEKYFKPYKEREGGKICEELGPKAQKMMENPSEEDKILIKKHRDYLKNQEEYRPLNMKNVSEDKLIEIALINKFLPQHPRIAFGQDLMGGYFNFRGFYLSRKQKNKE